MSSFSTDENAPPAVESPATTCTCTTAEEQRELTGEIRVFVEEDLVDEIELEFKELLDQNFFDEKRTKKPLRGILKRRKFKPTAAAATNIDEFPGRTSPTRRKLPKSQETTFSKGLDNKTPKKSTVKSPATTCTLTKEQVELIGKISRVFVDEKRTKEPFRGILKKKKLVLRKGLK